MIRFLVVFLAAIAAAATLASWCRTSIGWAFDVPLYSLLTFDGQIHIVAGLALLWSIAYLPALLYAAVCART